MDRNEDIDVQKSPGGPGAVRAQPPEETVVPELGPVKQVAGGIPAVAEALRHVVGEAGLIRGARLMLELNQFDGYDCPGCAWPDPDRHRSIAEFCENGAKAMAEEGTTARVDPAFFAEYSVADLSKESDYWLGKRGRLTHPMILRAGATHYAPISWEEAFARIAVELRDLQT